MEKITINNPIGVSVGGNAAVHEAQIKVQSLADVSDGYHTIAELYDHRITLFIALCRSLESTHRAMNWQFEGEVPGCPVWRSKTHSDGSVMDGWFIMGIKRQKGNQISYHLPMSHWDETNFAETFERAPEWDGHTSQDVLNRLKAL